MTTADRLSLCGVCGARVRQADHRGAHSPKKCLTCGRTLPLRDFDEHNSAADGYRRSCRACVAGNGTARSSTAAGPRTTTPPSAPAPAISYQERSTVYMLIGTLVHRAVLWPMVRPLTGERLGVFERAEFLAERAAVALAVLERSLRPLVAGGTDDDRDDALGVLNFEGPWDTGSFEPLWESLGEPARREVFRGLDGLVENAATGVSNAIRSRGILGDSVTCAWSEVPLFAVDGYFRPAAGESGAEENAHLRADLVIWREGGSIDVLDLKVGNTSPPEWAHNADREQVARYVAEVRRRVPADRRVRGSLIYVGRGPKGVRLERI